MSTYSPSLRIELITTGDQAGVWGNTTNTNLGTLVESAIAGYTSVSVISANQAFTALNGAADQSRNMTIALTTTTGAAFNVYAPPAEKTYVIDNASAYTATIYNSTVLGNTTAAGTGVAIPAGRTVTVWSDGTNFLFQNDHLPSLTLDTDLAIADGGTGASTAANARTNLGVTATGADTTYAFRANNLSDLASASSARTNIGLGSIATQNANAVSITGGSITGITDLAVADGGTGASDAAGARTNLGLGTIATQNANSVSITGGSITGITDLAVADGGTGASTFTSGGLLRGNGTSALSIASAADIVSQIGSTAVTNATNATNATTAATVSTTVASGAAGTTQTFGNNSTAIATTAFVQAALQALHPVGSIYINAGVATNPATLLGFGTWVAFGAGRVMVGLDGSDPLFDTLQETGGSKDATLVSHNHFGETGPQLVNHIHNFTIGRDFAGTKPGATGFREGPYGLTNSNGFEDTLSTATESANHSHNFTTSTSGSSATNANIQPYITVAMWRRTA
jgi:hypothetical protein